MQAPLLLLIAGLAAVARAQFVAGDENETAFSYLCDKKFSDANATGIYTFNPGVTQGPQDEQPDNDSRLALDAQWGVTVYSNIGETNSTAELSAWYNTNGANYSDSDGLWYDACVLTMNSLDINGYARGINDTGDCMETLDEPCIEALKEYTTSYTAAFIGNPSPNPGSNLTAGSINRVCYEVGNAMSENFPKQCDKFFNGSATVFGTALTSQQSQDESFLYDNNCTITDDEKNTTFHYATGSVLFTSQFTEEDQKILYSNLTQIILPVMAVFLPVADVDARTSIMNVNSVLTCPHINSINKGSLEPYPPPEPKPVRGSSGLSGGAIAGIVVGVLAVVVLVLAALWFFWFHKRRQENKGQVLGDADHSPPSYTADARFAEVPDQPLTELGGYDNEMRTELPGQKSWHELPVDAAHEKAADPPAELPAGMK